MNNLLLKRRVTELILKLEQLEEAEKENNRLRELLNFQRKSSYPLSLATVIGVSDNTSNGEVIR